LVAVGVLVAQDVWVFASALIVMFSDNGPIHPRVLANMGLVEVVWGRAAAEEVHGGSK
jgi:hypothetical protein